MASSIAKKSARLAFNFTNWNPSAVDWCECCSRVESQEVTRIQRFVFKKDAKAALAGRLLLRYFLTQELQVDNAALVFGRTEKGKPFLVEPSAASHTWSFNLSHNGDFVVLGAQKDGVIGIDVMKTEFPRGKNLDAYFTLMKSQFSTREWTFIKAPPQEPERLRNFYRLWCLKESYVKALGVGIGYSVSRLDFDLFDQILPSGRERKITLSVDNLDQTDWTFTEFTLDDQHVGAVAIHDSSEVAAFEQRNQAKFDLVEINEILQNLSPVSSLEDQLGSQFISKPDRPS